jgi:hypothetical protein
MEFGESANQAWETFARTGLHCHFASSLGASRRNREKKTGASSAPVRNTRKNMARNCRGHGQLAARSLVCVQIIARHSRSMLLKIVNAGLADHYRKSWARP